MPQKGTTGRYYCGKKLDYLCGCCNGNCGPTNGCNCTSCKKLDRKFLQPHRGTTGKYYCGRKVLKCKCCNGYCGPTSGCNCNDCQWFEENEQLKNSLFKESQMKELFQKMLKSHHKSEIKKSLEQSQIAKVEKKATSQILPKKKQPEYHQFKKQLEELNLSKNTIDILLQEEIHQWEILNQLTKEDLNHLKIKFGDIIKILSIRK